MNKIHEECGVFGIYSNQRTDIARSVYYGLFALQHRGQESCGIVVNDDGVFTSYKDAGIVNDVFTSERLASLGEGNISIGHVRYSTTGNDGRRNAQPIVVNHIKGHMALAHNGNLVNSFELRNALELQGSIFHTTSDTEVISYMITKERLTSPSIEEAVSRAMDKLEGAYSLVIMSPTKLIAVRDKNGFRPLCYGKTENGSYVVASESCALDAIGADFIRDVKPGEIIIFDQNGVRSDDSHTGKVNPSICIFEYIYFARPDSVIDGRSIHCRCLVILLTVIGLKPFHECITILAADQITANMSSLHHQVEIIEQRKRTIRSCPGKRTDKRILLIVGIEDDMRKLCGCPFSYCHSGRDTFDNSLFSGTNK